MIYLNVVCWGDSQTFGTRSYGCYPLYLSSILSNESGRNWRAINRSVNGYTARDLWFKVNNEVETIYDCAQACVMIGTNDCRVTDLSDPDLFYEYLSQIIIALQIKKYGNIFLSNIPPIFSIGYFPYTKKSEKHRIVLNKVIEEIANKTGVYLVKQDNLDKSCYVDAVHFNERGNYLVAKNFVNKILSI